MQQGAAAFMRRMCHVSALLCTCYLGLSTHFTSAFMLHRFWHITAVGQDGKWQVQPPSEHTQASGGRAQGLQLQHAQYSASSCRPLPVLSH